MKGFMARNRIGPDNTDIENQETKSKKAQTFIVSNVRTIYVIYSLSNNAIFTLNDKVGIPLS